MNRPLILIIYFTFGLTTVLAQEAGSNVYGSGRARKPQLNTGDLVTAANLNQSQFVEASVLMNVQPDAFVAVFGCVVEANDPAAGNALVNAKFADFIKSVESLGVKRSDIFIDYISQNRVFNYTETGNTITEKLAGFETKKNIGRSLYRPEYA